MKTIDDIPLLYELFKKRISNTNNSKNEKFHVAFSFYSKEKLNIVYNMSLGYNKHIVKNSYKERKKKGMIHAEIDCIRKLKQMNVNRHKNLIKIDICVVRFLLNGSLSISKPCFNCLREMEILALKKGYKIINIYYSDKNQQIVKTKYSRLKNEQKQHFTIWSRHINDYDNYN